MEQRLLLPAWQTLIRTHVVRNHFDLALTDMLAMAQALQEHRGA